MFRVATIAGTTVDVRISFLVLSGLFVLINLDGRVPLQFALLWIPVLFISVLVHELAHAATIGAFGFGASRIELGGWGGETTNRRRAKPWQEVLISLAGPLSSFALAILFKLILANLALGRTSALLVEFLSLMILANQAWAIFNLVPIVPLDGGHVVLHGLRQVMRPELAFTIATWVSIVLGTALGLASAFLWRQWFIAIIAASLVMQNWAHWQQLKRIRAERQAPPSDAG